MDIQIGQDVIEKTTECDKNFSCLCGDKKDFCEIENPAESVFFVEKPKKDTCQYRQPLARFYLCTCPTRQEIYKRYNI
jgi:hypothetical protein